jgi:tryptophan-rich sensory protein
MDLTQLKSFFEDNAEGYSMMRLVFFLWMLVLCFNITYNTIHFKELKPIDSSYVTLTLGLAVAKAAQRMGENEPK